MSTDPNEKGLERLLTVESKGASGMDLRPRAGIQNVDLNRVRGASGSLIQAWYGGNIHPQTQRTELLRIGTSDILRSACAPATTGTQRHQQKRKKIID